MPGVEPFALVGLEEASLAAEAIADDRNRVVLHVIVVTATTSDEARLGSFKFPVFALNKIASEEADALNLPTE